MTFMDDYQSGKTNGADIDDYIGEWHHDNRLPEHYAALHDYLGMTWSQYKNWFNNAELPQRGAP